MIENTTSTTGDTKAIFSILKQALEIEEKGRRFYLEAAQTTQDKRGQEIYATLADDELKHYDLIKRQQTALTDKGMWAKSSEIKPVDIDLSKPLFPEGREALEKKVTAKSNDWDALIFGLDIETQSYDLYRRAASGTTDVSGKQMFEFLA